jgi:hypothetical protein
MKYKISKHNVAVKFMTKLAKKFGSFSDVFGRFLPSKRLALLMLAGVMVFSIVADLLVGMNERKQYVLSGETQELLHDPVPSLDVLFEPDEEAKAISFNRGYSPGGESAGDGARSKFKAMFYNDPDEGVEVTDAQNNISITIKPQFRLGQPQQEDNRIIYPLRGKDGAKVISMGSSGFKEDIILEEFTEDTLSFSYELVMPAGLEARIEPDGSLGIYGVDLTLLGNISTGTDADAKLLEEARNNGEKKNLLFSAPAPFIVEGEQELSPARASYSLKDDVLTITATELSSAKYPISVDPSIYIETARKLMRGNNETNIDFDIDNELIKKGFTTGARFDEWEDTMNLNEGRWNQGTTVAGGYIYAVGGEKTELASTTYGSAGSNVFAVPAGVTSITVEMWGAGGGGGGGGGGGEAGGAGGGGGYTRTTIAVTPAENLNVIVGGGGSGGTGSANSGAGGGGGGHSEVNRSGTALAIAGGGGGGGGANNASAADAGAGGAGGGSSGQAGSASGAAGGGGAGTQVAVGAAGSGGRNPGTAGGTELGGEGADGRAGTGADGSANNGGSNGGADGGSVITSGCPAGGGGGGGFRGGGGASSGAGTGGSCNSGTQTGGGGGGGGSGYTTGTSPTTTVGVGTVPGNDSDSDRSGAADGGPGGSAGNNGTAGDSGRIILTYVNAATSGATADVYWAKLSTTNNSIESPNPGNGACTDWCTNSAYDLPDERAGFSLVAYNGFLYAIGGVDDSGTRSNYVYISKLGVNGEPSLWHPTDSNKNNWVYWWRDTGTNLSSERSYLSAAAYNNRLYVLGGQTNASSGGVTTVEMTELSPTGDIGTWSSADTTALPSARHSHATHIYNDRIYLIGGNSSGALQSSVHYSKLDNDGGMNSWVSTQSMATAKMTWGGNFSVIWGGYLYQMGGCSAVNGSGYCTTIEDDVEVASLNADGSVAPFATVGGVTNERIGFGLLAWDNALYRIGGCSAQNTTSGDCTTVLNDEDYAVINPDGDASTVNNSEPSGSGDCISPDFENCDLPPQGDDAGEGGQMASAVVFNNGYIYNIGGCADITGTDECFAGDAMSGNVSYAAISSTGTLVEPATCSGTSYGAWCVDSTNRINGTTGLGSAAATVFNNTIYVLGGTTGTNWMDDIWRVSVNTNGSLSGAWSSQTFNSVGMASSSASGDDERGYMYAFTRSNPSSAGSNPGNLYVMGGCRGSGGVTDDGIGCGSYYTNTIKCNIATAGTINGCTESGQLQIDADNVNSGSQGLGLMAGTVYANYLYLVGGSCASVGATATAPCGSTYAANRRDTIYAEIDNSNNIVAANGGSAWAFTTGKMNPVRRRAVSFGYNGYIYSLAGYSGTASLQDLLFAKIDVSTGDIDNFSSSGVVVTPRWDLRAIVSNGYVYAIGGCGTTDVPPGAPTGCTDMQEEVQTFQLYNNDSGAPVSYSASANQFATDRMGASAAILNGYIYIAGGCTTTAAGVCTAATDNVQFAEIDEQGVVQGWNNTTDSTLPGARAYGQLEAAGGTLYFIGGQESTATNESADIYWGTPSTSNGNVASWTDSSNDLPAARTQHSAAVWNDRIYVTGGLDGSAAATTTVYASPDLSSGGTIGSAWTTTNMTAFTVARSGHTAIAYANNLYILGGHTGSNYLLDVQFAQINANGEVGAWTYTTSLPEPMRQADGFAVNGYMYLIGGRTNDTTCASNSWVAPISANTTIASGNNPTGVGEWYETNAKYTGDRYGASALYNDGKIFVVGGGCGASGTLTGANRVSQTAVYSQNQIAKYSRMIDTDSDVFPTQWLMNGIDNSIGAKWKVKYRSSTNTASAWGDETDFGDVSLGTVEDYIPLDDLSVDTEFARFFYFSVAIDSSKAFGYPEDVDRGPTINDLTLFFTADPSKRLRHGKSFTGGEKQPLDTPPPP